MADKPAPKALSKPGTGQPPKENPKVAALKRRADRDLPNVRNEDALEGGDRITISGYIHHESFGERPTTVPLRFSDMLETKYQSISRRITISEETKLSSLLPMFGVPEDHVGYLWIENRVGAGQLTNPTPDQTEEIKKQALWVNGFQVRPGKLMFAEACGDIVFKPLDKPVSINLCVFPK